MVHDINRDSIRNSFPVDNRNFFPNRLHTPSHMLTSAQRVAHRGASVYVRGWGFYKLQI
mgnify:CR=1 FL=1